MTLRASAFDMGYNDKGDITDVQYKETIKILDEQKKAYQDYINKFPLIREIKAYEPYWFKALYDYEFNMEMMEDEFGSDCREVVGMKGKIDDLGISDSHQLKLTLSKNAREFHNTRQIDSQAYDEMVQTYKFLISTEEEYNAKVKAVGIKTHREIEEEIC